MTARAGDWSLLDHGSDPVAGDPAAVRSKASYYADMAETIRKEASRLKTLGQDGDLVGKYAKSLQKDLGDLSGEVDKAYQRYDEVGAALKPFATALDNARAESWGALQDAVRAHGDEVAAQNRPQAQAKNDKPLTDAEKSQNSARSQAISDANAALGRAKTRLSNALSDLKSAGKKAAEAINDGANDGLKDHHHWWDVVVKIIKVVVEILNYAVIVLAVAAIFCTGLGAAILLISAVILALDIALAATGNGSWMDVAIDVVGLATCGVGSAAAKGGEMAAKSGVKAAVKFETKALAEGGIARRAFTYFGRRAAATSKVTAFADDAVKGLGKLKGLRTADREMAQDLAKLKALDGAYGEQVPKIARRLGQINTLGNITAGAGYTGLGTVLGNTLASPSNLPWLQDNKFKWDGFNNFKDSFVNEDAGPHAYDFHWSDLNYSAGSLLETAGPRTN